MTNHFSKRVPLPSPEEIRRACARIRRGWTEQQRAERRVGTAPSWEAPVLPAAVFRIDERDKESD